MQQLLKHLNNDQSLRAIFQVTQALLNKINLEPHLTSSEQDEKEAAQNLALFFLKYCRVSFDDISQN